MSTAEQLTVALNAFLAETDPDEKERLRLAFDRLFAESMRSKTRTAPDWQRAAAGDRSE